MRATEFLNESKLSDFCTIKTNFPDADFWLIRKGSEDKVGKPVTEFNSENIGIKVNATDKIDSKYLYYLMMHLYNQGFFRKMATGAIRLVQIRASDIRDIAVMLNEATVSVNYGIGKNPGKLVPVGKNGRVPHAKLHVNVPKATAKKLGIPYDITETTIKLSGFGPSEENKAFVAKVNSMFPQSPLNPNYRIMTFGEGNDMSIVQFELKPLAKSVEVKWIQATPLRTGAGSKAMKILQDLAQKDGIKLTLYAWDKGQVSQAKLMKFYKKQGFTPLGKSGNMEWYPK